MSGLPPSYDEVAGSSHNTDAPPPHEFGGSKQYGHPSAQEEKAQMAAAMANSGPPNTGSSTGPSAGGDKVLKIWHAASGNSLITAADEKTPIYNIIDSRAPDEAEQKTQSARVYDEYNKRDKNHPQQSQQSQQFASGQQQQQQQQQQQPGNTAGLTRSQAGDVPADVEFAQQIQSERANPYARPGKLSNIWHLAVRRGGDRNSPVLAVIKRHINTKSAVGIHFGNDVKTGIEQFTGFPHTKYVFKWQGREFTWTRTHKAPNTSRLDSGNYVCRDENKTIYAYATAEDDRCDGSMRFEDVTLSEGLLDIMTITAFVMRDLDSERRAPRYNGVYGAGGYGPYGNPYLTSAYGYYPVGYGYPGYGFGYGGLGMPLLF